MKKGVLINLTPKIRLRVEQLLECWNNLFVLKQEFGNCPHCPTIQVIISPQLSCDFSAGVRNSSFSTRVSGNTAATICNG